MKRIIASLILIIFITSLLSACESKKGLDPDNPVTLTMWHVYGSQTKSPFNVVSSFPFGVGVFVSLTAPSATFIDTVPLQSENSLL